MSTRRTATQRLDEEIANVGAPPRDNKVPPHKGVANDDQALVNPPHFIDGDIRATFIKIYQAINTKSQAVTTLA